MEAEPSTEALAQSGSHRAVAWASSRHVTASELIKSLRPCSSGSDSEGFHKILRFQKRESRGNTDTLESKAMPGALVSNRMLPILALGMEDAHKGCMCFTEHFLFH